MKCSKLKQQQAENKRDRTVSLLIALDQLSQKTAHISGYLLEFRVNFQVVISMILNGENSQVPLSPMRLHFLFTNDLYGPHLSQN